MIMGVFLETVSSVIVLTPRNMFLEESNPAANIRAL